jgi:soluble lytic murein transglycosylase
MWGKRFWKIWLVLLSALILCLYLAERADHIGRRQRLQRIFDAAVTAAAEFSVPLPLILAVIEVESDFRPEVISAAGAHGLMQLTPETFAFLRDERLHEQLPDEAILAPATNIRYGACYLSYLQEKFQDRSTALAAYNAGERRVSEWLKDPALSASGVTLDRIPFPETENYVKKVLVAFEFYDKNIHDIY